MSLSSMAAMRAEADNPAPGGGAADQATVTKLRDQLVALIPAESLAVFLVAMSVVADESYMVRWVLVGIVAAGTALWVNTHYRENTKQHRDHRKLPLLEMSVGTAAFVAWATTVPATPFLQIPGYKLEMGVAVIAGAAFLLVPLVRSRAKWTPDNQPAIVDMEPKASPT
jgi:hypothetical protein